jgi:hypothetical protein
VVDVAVYSGCRVDEGRPTRLPQMFLGALSSSSSHMEFRQLSPYLSIYSSQSIHIDLFETESQRTVAAVLRGGSLVSQSTEMADKGEKGVGRLALLWALGGYMSKWWEGGQQEIAACGRRVPGCHSV